MLILTTISLLGYFSGVSYFSSPRSSVKKLQSKINNIRKGAAYNTLILYLIHKTSHLNEAEVQFPPCQNRFSQHKWTRTES